MRRQTCNVCKCENFIQKINTEIQNGFGRTIWAFICEAFNAVKKYKLHSKAKFIYGVKFCKSTFEDSVDHTTALPRLRHARQTYRRSTDKQQMCYKYNVDYVSIDLLPSSRSRSCGSCVQALTFPGAHNASTSICLHVKHVRALWNKLHWPRESSSNTSAQKKSVVGLSLRYNNKSRTTQHADPVGTATAAPPAISTHSPAAAAPLRSITPVLGWPEKLLPLPSQEATGFAFVAQRLCHNFGNDCCRPTGSSPNLPTQ